jgi:NAD(P)-dependent dehydrogenase (short-subunit alcohol dehydrogenase family)
MSPDQRITPSSVVLVSGGARGITAQCVVKLAERTKCKFILLGRSAAESPKIAGAQNVTDESVLKQLIMDDLKAKGEKPSLQKVQKIFRSIQSNREIQETLDAVQTAGGHAEYIQVDITNRDDLQEKLAEPVHRLGKINGIIHGAGNLADKLIEKKSVQDYEMVFAAKVDGLENILSSVPVAQLNFLVLFSSIVGFYGNVGQADYAMANEILNKTAHLIKRKNPDCHVVSIGWGPWDSGMVTPELKKAFEERDVKVIPADVGASILVEELLPSVEEIVQVVVGNAPPRPIEEGNSELRHYEIRRKLSLDANPFLNDHRIGSNPVLPATCAATWVASACEQLYPAHTFSTLENYKVLKGIVFDDNLADEYVLDLKETAKSPNGDVEFDALIWSLTKSGKKLFNYSLLVKLSKEPLPQPALDAINMQEGAAHESIHGQQLYEDGTLFHGPAFQGVQQVLHVSPGKLIMRVELPQLTEKIQGQFPVQTGNPFIYDAIVQGLLIWAQRFYQAPCLPSYMEKLEHYKAIPFGQPIHVSLAIRSQSETAVVGDLTVQDPQGETYMRILGLQGTISPRLNSLIGRKNNA